MVVGVDTVECWTICTVFVKANNVARSLCHRRCIRMDVCYCLARGKLPGRDTPRNDTKHSAIIRKYSWHTVFRHSSIVVRRLVRSVAAILLLRRS